jgi:hypothetical protein
MFFYTLKNLRENGPGSRRRMRTRWKKMMALLISGKKRLVDVLFIFIIIAD